MAKPKQSERMEQAKKIASNPIAYKVCEGCDSILGASVVMCPSCHAYRFDDDPNRVVDQALELGSREQRSVTMSDLS